MPAKIDAEANLRFLYVCFKHSNFSTIDYHKVAAHFQIKAPAARMRLMRLRMALEGESSKDHRGKKGKEDKSGGKGKAYVFYDDEDDDDEALDNLPLADRMNLRLLRMKREEGVKREDGWEVGVKREGGWGGVKKEDEDEKGRVKLEVFDTPLKTEQGTEGFDSSELKMEQDIKTEGEARLAYPAPFTFAPTQPTFFNPFSQVKTEPGFRPDTSFPGYHGQTYHQPDTPMPSITTNRFSTPQPTDTMSIEPNTPISYHNPPSHPDTPMQNATTTTPRPNSPLGTDIANHTFTDATPGITSSPITPLKPSSFNPISLPPSTGHASPAEPHTPTPIDTPMLEADILDTNNNSPPSGSNAAPIVSSKQDTPTDTSIKDDAIEATDQNILDQNISVTNPR